MGEREAGMAELAAMQEPLRQERQRQRHQQDYMENVRARAAERAREILAAAYAEREKILEDARREAGEQSLKLGRENGALKAAAEAEHARAAEEREAAAALRREAEEIRNAARSEGFQSGMEQAGTELVEFRAELGASLAALLRAVEDQRRSINAFWREDVAELVRAAVTAGTGWTLKNEHENILRALVLNSLDMLEDSSALTLRVHPEDEAQIGELFAAARERAPELKQWVVAADAGIEYGGFTMESVHGSVEGRREYFREMVEGVLANLVLPAGEDGIDHDPVDGEDVHELVEREVEKITRLAPPPAAAPDAAPAPLSEESPEIAACSAEETPFPVAPRLEAETDSVAMAAEPEARSWPEHASAPETESLPEDFSEAPAVGAGEADGQTGPDADPDNAAAEKAEPTMAELEDELFSRQADAFGDTSAILAEGGFLPGKGKHET